MVVRDGAQNVCVVLYLLATVKENAPSQFEWKERVII